MRLMILPFGVSLAAASLVLACATVPAAARTGCDSYGRCFDFSGPSDRLADSQALWQRAEGPAADAADASADPMALAHGTLGDPLQALADDD